MNELCDEKRFDKNVGGPLEQLRHGVNSGLFTGHTDEEDWGVAHRTLVPAFGPLNITAMFDDMKGLRVFARSCCRLPLTHDGKRHRFTAGTEMGPIRLVI